MDSESFLEQHRLLIRSLYTRCKGLNARIAVVGCRESALILLNVVQNTDIPFAGIYEQARFQTRNDLNGLPIRPIAELKKLKADDVVVVASSMPATELQDTYALIRSLCPCRVVDFKILTDLFQIGTGLQKPLDIQFGDFLFGRGLQPLPGEYPYWQPLPPKVDFTGKVVLELGPFEGNNSVMLMALNPKKVIGIEARPVNYAKHAVMQSLYGWTNYTLMLGDMHLFPQMIREKIDIIFCSGVFYHSNKPWWLLQSCMEHCDTILLNGHVASDKRPTGHKTRTVTLESGTYEFEIYPEYGWGDPLSGVISDSLWFKEADLIRFLDYYGFRYEKYSSTLNPTGYWIDSVVTKK